MSRRVDRERPSPRRLVTDEQAHQALEDLMWTIEALTDADALLAEVRPFMEAKSLEGELLATIIKAFRKVDEHSPAIDAYIRWLQLNTEEEEEGKIR